MGSGDERVPLFPFNPSFAVPRNPPARVL